MTAWVHSAFTKSPGPRSDSRASKRARIETPCCWFVLRLNVPLGVNQSNVLILGTVSEQRPAFQRDPRTLSKREAVDSYRALTTRYRRMAGGGRASVRLPGIARPRATVRCRRWRDLDLFGIGYQRDRHDRSGAFYRLCASRRARRAFARASGPVKISNSHRPSSSNHSTRHWPRSSKTLAGSVPDLLIVLVFQRRPDDTSIISRNRLLRDL